MARAKSFTFAINGLYQLLRNEPNAVLHTIATVAVVAAGIVRHIGPMQWVAIVIAIGLVWITEAVNTGMERLCDHVCGNRFHPAIKLVKDVMAAAVMMAAGVSVVIGIIVFFF
ncbi:diacylglycerol kinase family protein [Nemorincola caseinilytica]|uniref:Diacylglycerol kinase family protein n=1 Tax=Nemorincola caseinilytica TaxID=2054315 RepID=A0ABP8NFZ8_9BACT